MRCAGEHRLDLRHPPRDRGHSTQNHPSRPADLAIHVHNHGDADDRVGPRLAIHLLVIGAARAGFRRGQMDLRQHFIVRQDVLARRIIGRQLEEIGRGDGPLARGTNDAKFRVQRDQRRRGIRRMHDKARAAAENRVEFVLAGNAEAGLPAVLVARESVAVIPAPRPLADVARERPGVADLGRSHVTRRFGEHVVVLADERIAAQRVERDQPADHHLPALLRHTIERADRFEIDQHVGRDQAFLDHPEKIAATADDRRTLPLLRGFLELAGGVLQIARIDVREGFHASTPKILSRVMGRLLTRRPIAL